MPGYCVPRCNPARCTQCYNMTCCRRYNPNAGKEAYERVLKNYLPRCPTVCPEHRAEVDCKLCHPSIGYCKPGYPPRCYDLMYPGVLPPSSGRRNTKRFGARPTIEHRCCPHVPLRLNSLDYIQQW
ncbi:uncharacterized protein LOC126267946 [Schistocerca gregaria]|uniref:uncharacterized protein LOC126267946 n=1 Tax=Schistocerca gregaria TaxID=7010 RepID=UPI00211E5D6E|nr:uncharacterized protein LOC126267946 [Schistocerca gregaria]